MKLDLNKITDIELDGIDKKDYPDFADAFVASASYEGRPMTDDELDILNNESEYVYKQVIKSIY